MGDLLADVATYGFGTLLCTALLCGFCPVLVLRLLLLLYPADHDRRAEWLREVEEVPWRERLVWVAALIPTAFFEGLTERMRPRPANRALTLDRPLVGIVDDTYIIGFTGNAQREEMRDLLGARLKVGDKVMVSIPACSEYRVFRHLVTAADLDTNHDWLPRQ